MIKRFVIVAVFTFLATTCYTQDISVSNFNILETDLTANMIETMEKDLNGETAALIKVVTTHSGFSFDIGKLPIVKTIQKPSEIWIYIPHGIEKMTISHPLFGVLHDYHFPIAIEAARTYELVLNTSNTKDIGQTVNKQYVLFQLSPPDATLELNGTILQSKQGFVSKVLEYGTYGYKVSAPDYYPVTGQITINGTTNKTIENIVLHPIFVLSKENKKGEREKTDNEDILCINTTVNKNRVELGDSIECEFRIYTNLSLWELVKKMPYQIDWAYMRLLSDKNITFESNQYEKHGELRSALYYKIIIVPLQTGKFNFPPMEYKAHYSKVIKGIDPFDAFKSGMTPYIEKDTIIRSNPVELFVEDRHTPIANSKTEITITSHPSPFGIVIDRSSSLDTKEDTTSITYSQLEESFIKQLMTNNNKKYSYTIFSHKPHYLKKAELKKPLNTYMKSDAGSAIYDGILASALQSGSISADDTPFSILLLTDGPDNSSSISENTLTNILLKNQIRVDVIAFASKKDSILCRNSYDSTGNKKNNVYSTKYVMIKNEANLSGVKKIAEATNGFFGIIENEKQIPIVLARYREFQDENRRPVKKPDTDFHPDPTVLNTLYNKIISTAKSSF